jgi:CubicO group peptidase (beta-lactamase class C family)
MPGIPIALEETGMNTRLVLRRTSVFLLSAAALCSVVSSAESQSSSAPWPTNGWTRSTPEAQGLKPAPLDSLHRNIAANQYGNVDRLVIVRNGYLVMSERYPRDYRAISAGTDTTSHQFNYQHPDWHPYHKGRNVHTLQSVTKSVTSALVGIALAKGKISGLDAPLLSFFPEYDLSAIDPRLRQATLEDLLTMRTGIEWHETDRPIDSSNTTIQLEASKDWIRFTLSQPMDAAPRSKWVYNSGGSALMAAVIRHATGQHAHAYAEANLFGPLGIRDYHWKITPTGHPDTEGGLYLEAEDLARIGYLYLNRGMWNGRRILPESWVTASVARQVESVNQAGWGYGYQWWRLDRNDVEIWAGLGYGGQFLIVMPQYNMIGVVNSWNVFGQRVAGVLGPMITAMIGSAREAPPGRVTGGSR